MKVVWKFPFPIKDVFELEFPIGSELLHFDVQPNIGLCIWALVDDLNVANSFEVRRFRFAGTGHSLDEPERFPVSWIEGRGLPTKYEHVGTIMLYGGNQVYHLFELKWS